MINKIINFFKDKAKRKKFILAFFIISCFIVNALLYIDAERMYIGFQRNDFVFYGLIFSAIMFMCLIVYYLSIMADALSKRTKELEEREKKINEKK